jgi:hypothetical protein
VDHHLYSFLFLDHTFELDHLCSPLAHSHGLFPCQIANTGSLAVERVAQVVYFLVVVGEAEEM